jgi:ParB family chromosome partitioning protein
MGKIDLSGLEAPVSVGAPSRAALKYFEEDPSNPRIEFDGPGFEQLVEDIGQRGILQPIVAVRLSSGKLQVRFGARRLRAAIRLGLPDVPYVVTEDRRQFDDYAQISENERREGLQPHELAAFMVKRLAAGDNKALLADKLGVDPSVITHHLNLVEGPAFILDLYSTRKCRSPKYLYTLSRLHAKNPALVEARVAGAAEINSTFLSALSLGLESGQAIRTLPNDDLKEGASSRPAPSTTSQAAERLDAKPIRVAELGPKGGSDELAPTRIKRPLLLGRHKGREVRVFVDRLPTAPGLIFIENRNDGIHEEVAVSEVTLSWLGETA